MKKKLANSHEQLINDLQVLLDQGKAFEFHDFKNNKYSSPKTELIKKLAEISENVVSGKYDN